MGNADAYCTEKTFFFLSTITSADGTSQTKRTDSAFKPGFKQDVRCSATEMRYSERMATGGEGIRDTW